MIKKISLKVASYNETTSLETDKKVNLIYGLNGTGKSAFSEFLRKIGTDDEKFKECSIETDNYEDNSKLSSNEQILVYNQEWVNENFYESPTLKGIFSLSKENADGRMVQRNEHWLEQKSKVKNLLATDEYKRLMKKRSTECETVFGQIKANQKFRRFHLRGSEKVGTEWGLLMLGYDFKQIARLI